MAVTRLVRAFAGHSVLTVGQQALTAVAGILIVRGLDKADYAQYVLAFNLSSAIGILAEAGVVATLMRVGATVRDDRDAMDDLIREGVRFRRRSTLLAATLFLPVICCLLARSGLGWLEIGLLAALTISGSFTTAASQMSAALQRLDYRFVKVGSVQVCGALVRLLGTGIALLAPSTAAVVWLLVVNVLIGSLEVRLYGKLSRRHLGGAATDSELAQDFRTNARRTAPNNAFYLIQGQALVWGLAALGDVTTLAEVVALGRFGLLFTLLMVILANFIMPVFARQQTASGVRRVILLSVGAYTGLGLIALGTMWQFSAVYLSILGPGYAGLRDDLVLVSVGFLVTGLTGVLTAMTQGRAWLKWSWIYIPMTTGWLLVLAFTVGIETLDRAALFSALTPTTGLASELVLLVTGYRREFGRRRTTPTGPDLPVGQPTDRR